MTERRVRLLRLSPAALVALLAVTWLAPADGPLALAPGRSDAAATWASTVSALGDAPVVLVAFDPDLGTYAEIRPTVRTAIADLLARDARLAFLSLTPEGRAIFLAERARLASAGANPDRLADLGYLPGSEAAIVSIAGGLPPATEPGALARGLAAEGAAGVDALLVVGGNDLGPRSWVEQLLPRLSPDPALLAVTPTSLLPEVRPYLESGQVDALLATPRDGAAYRAGVDLDRADRLAVDAAPRPLPVLAGLLVAIAVLGQAWLSRVAGRLRVAARATRESA